MTAVPNPIPYFTDLDGDPLDGGFIYVGIAGMDARTNPIQVYWDEGLSIPAAQPIRTVNGYPLYQGRPAPFFITEAEASITVLQSNGVAVVTNADFSGVSVGQIAFSHADTYQDGSVGEKLQQTINPMDAPYSAAGDGIADDRAELSAADTAAFAAGRPLYITGRHLIGSNLTLQSDLIFIGGTLEPITAVTVTCTGIVTGGLEQLFAGLGSVVGIREVRPEWFGAVRDGTTNDQPAIQKAHDCVEAAYAADSRGGRATVIMAAGEYGIAAPIKLRPTASTNLKFVGQGPLLSGTRFQVLSSFSAATGAMAILVDGNADAIQRIASLEIGDFAIIPYTAGASTCTIGMQVGNDGLDLIGVQQSQIRDLYIDNGFPTGFRLGNFRLIDFNRCSVWNQTLASSKCVQFFADTSSSFCGDINFNSCQFVANTSAECVDFSIGTASAQIKGVRFNNVTFYKANKSVIFSPSNGAIVGDIWFNPGCQFDGQQNDVIYGRPTGASTILDDIHIKGCYFRGINSGFVCVDLRALSSAKLRAIWVSGCWFANIVDGSKAVVISDARNVHVDYNSLSECNSTTAEMILFGPNVFSFTIIGNTLDQDTAITVDWLITTGVGCDYGAVVHNSTNGAFAVAPTRNLSAGANLTLTPNW